MVKEGELLWTPRVEFAHESNLAVYMDWLKSERGHAFTDYEALRQWSVSDLEGFWSSIWDYFAVQSATPYHSVVSSRSMPGAKWFEGSKVNYAEHLLRYHWHPEFERASIADAVRSFRQRAKT